MHSVTKEVRTNKESLGSFNFPVYENMEEMVAKFGAEIVFKFASRSYAADIERVARDARRGDNPKSEAETQALIDSYKPGSRGGKVTLKTLLAMLTEFGQAGAINQMLHGQVLFNEQGLEAAYAYLVEEKAKGI